jgi:hypothetical protein
MPPYYSLNFGVRDTNIQPGFVASVYEAIFAAGFPFAGVASRFCPSEMKLDAIVDWNQQRLERKFVLGFEDHLSLDYRQILLAHPLYSHCRLYIYARDSQFVLIVPEAEVFENYAGPVLENHADLGFVAERVRSLEMLARHVWSSGLFAAIQTNGELGYSPTVSELDTGKAASVVPFAVLDDRNFTSQRFDEASCTIESLPNGGHFIRMRNGNHCRQRLLDVRLLGASPRPRR